MKFKLQSSCAFFIGYGSAACFHDDATTDMGFLIAWE